ncbi:hypothetical protein [Streptomyces candidus]|uniref:Uncharacterized protein n=1 Tax=Streptomyces candidus TaxID=67283 RepID=A0A7X0LSJ9_9ACTN|nr:hypothetical protein [Streptomyces candidus]MBB6438554.1 hypothetical protein [Streptomyces candidus]
MRCQREYRSTLALLHHDLSEGNLRHNDLACFSGVVYGPERGAFLAPLRLPARST